MSKCPINGSKFTENSLGPNSEVHCETSIVCHLIVETSQQGTQCPKIKNTNPSVKGDEISDVYVFDPKQSTVNSKIRCTTDVAIKPSVSEAGRKEVCVTIEKSSGSQSDTRCYKVIVERGDACKPVECLNGGICKSVDNNEWIAVCVCPLGYSGNICQNKKDNSVTPFTGEEIPDAVTNKGIPKFTATSLPETIHCVVDQPCHLPMRVTDPTGNTPVIGFGQVDPGIITSPVVVTPSGNKTYTTDVVVTPTKLGKRRVCVQTKNTENVNMDEVCYNIETSEKTTSGQGSPKFTESTISENSVVVCQPGQTCHIPLTYESSNNTCEKVAETTFIKEVHIFQDSSAVGQTCTVDVGFTPTHDAGGTQHMCFKPGNKGEKRCIMVNIQDTSSLSSTPCQNHHCFGDGFCSVPSGTQAVCTCRLGSTGPRCQKDSTSSVVPVTGSATQEPNFVDTVVPREVKCYNGRECLIPFAVKGNSHSVEVGDHDNGMNTTIKPSTKLTSTDSVYEHIISVTPQTSEGKKEICVKTKTGKDDQICFIVDVVDPPANQGTTPDFTGTTLGPDSTVECQTETLCHVQIQTNQTNGKCPAILENTDKTSISDVHIFPPQTNQCTTDVVLKPRVTETGQKQLCVHFNAGTVSKQENKERCFKVTVSNTIDPCVPVYCMNNGECQINNGQGECICPSGFTGGKCENVKSEKVTAVNLGVINPAQELPHFTRTAVPKIIICVQDMPCHIPLTVTDPSGKKPSVKYGKVDPGIDTEKPKLTPINGTKDFTTDITITPQEPGTKSLCVQTETSLGMNVDEICYQIQTSAIRPSPGGHPAFTAPTVTDSSTLLCEIGEICHIPLTYEGLKGTCEEVNEMPTHTTGVHIFKPPVQPTAVDKTCTTEIAYKPSTTGPTKLCFKPGSLGEKRCIKIEGEPSGNKLSTPCQSLHCKNSGECIADNKGTPKCVCTLGKSGVHCSQDSSNFITDRVNKTKPAFTDTVLPQTIVCYKLEKCTVPFVVTSTAGNNPTVKKGQTNPGKVATGPSTPTQITGTDSYKTEITINSTDNGVKLACVQTQGPSGKTIDEICIKVKVIDHPMTATTTLPGFTEKTFKPESILGCKVDQDCHLPMETTKNSNGKCPTLSKDTLKTTIQDVLPLETILSTVDSTCQTDVVIHPNSTEMGIHEVCIQINVSPSEEPRCYKLNVTQSLVTTTTFTSTVTTTTSVETTITTTVGSLKTTKVAATTSVETTFTTTVGSIKTTMVAAKTNNTKTSKATTNTNTSAASNSNKTIQRIATTNNPKAAGTTDNAKTTKAAATIKTIPKVTASASASTNTTMSGNFTGNKTLLGVATTGTNAKSNIAATAPHSINIHNLVKPDDKTTKIGLPTTNGNPTQTVTTANGKATTLTARTSSQIIKTAATANTKNAFVTILTNIRKTKVSTINAKTKKGAQGSCNQMTAAQALEAAQMGRVSCYCMVNGTRREIIRSNPKATTEQLLKAAGIGAGSTTGAMVIAWLIYMLVSKVKSSAQNKLPPTPRPRKVKPSRRKSLGSAFT
ncbi:mucin-22-like [Mytilus edulis]|uniref:mucin-22-like n=1 Tax=Mytilus edulis TaxID=6550 RepID=UPI0039F0CAD8